MSNDRQWPRAEVLEFIRTRLGEEPEVVDWPELGRAVGRRVKEHSKPSWEYALHSCEAVGSELPAAYPAAAAIFCMLFSIHLVDDLLDEDPEGWYHEIGIGTSANLAVAFQGLAARLVGSSAISAERRAAAQVSIGSMAVATAFGQNLDSSDPEGEEGYWRVVRSKTPPLFGCALELGAIYGGADLDLAAEIATLGDPLGRIVQINDDLKDALEKPAGPDWQRQWTNLPILFARIADHADRERFVELVPRVTDLEQLEEAQAILVRSGAFSYCAYQLIEAYKEALATIAQLDVPNPDSLRSLIEIQVAPLRKLLRSVGIENVDAVFSV